MDIGRGRANISFTLSINRPFRSGEYGVGGAIRKINSHDWIVKFHAFCDNVCRRWKNWPLAKRRFLLESRKSIIKPAIIHPSYPTLFSVSILSPINCNFIDAIKYPDRGILFKVCRVAGSLNRTMNSATMQLLFIFLSIKLSYF